jgi:uncharacterized iron-regulated protein
MPPTNNFEPQSLQNGWNYGIKNYCIEIHLNGVTSLQNIMKIYQAVQKLLVGDTHAHTHRHRQTDWILDKPTFIFGK